MLLITIAIGIFLFSTAPRYISFRELTQKLEPNILKIINDKKITESDVDALLEVTHKYTYNESHTCNPKDDECYEPEPTKEELTSYYIKFGYPASEWNYRQEKKLKQILMDELKNDSYYYDRYAREENNTLLIFINSKNIENRTIMLKIVSVGEIQEIDEIIIGETDIFRLNF